MPPQFEGRGAPRQDYPPSSQPQFQPARQPAPQQWPAREASDYARPQALAAQPLRKTSLTAAEQFSYVLMNIGFGAGYFAKIPGKKALNDFGLVEMSAAEKFWYVMMCIPMGAGYFAKVRSRRRSPKCSAGNLASTDPSSSRSFSATASSDFSR
jgi:hypothetical protein